MESDPAEWSCTVDLGIDDVRALHSSIAYLIEMWPGSPARPASEQEYLHYVKNQLFAMMMDYNYNYLTGEK
jgi:hypothetical protein